MADLVARDGARLAYDDLGSGRPLLLLHGWATHAGFFAPQAAALAGSFRLILPDLRGHGRSRLPAAAPPPTVQGLADDLCQLLAALDLTGVVAVGWSLGALVLWRAMAAAGTASRLAGMVSIDMSPKVLNGPDWSAGLRGSGRHPVPATPALAEHWPVLAPRIARRIFAPGRAATDPALVAWTEDQIAACDAAAMASLWTSLAAADCRDTLPTLPLLLAHGRQSQLYGAETIQWLTRRRPEARLALFERSGHAPQLEEPAAFTAVLRDFIAGLPGAP